MEVIYVDNHLLVAVKPAAIATQPHAAEEDNFLDRAKRWVKSTYDKPGNVFLEPIHRLDKPVSGIVLFARTSKALSRLQSMMREQAIEKTYIGLIEGALPSEEGVLEHFLVHASHRAVVVPPNHPEGKRARLRYRLIKRKGTEAVAKLLCPERSMILRPFESGSQAATTYSTRLRRHIARSSGPCYVAKQPSGSIEEERLEGPKKGDFNGQMSFATASTLSVIEITLETGRYHQIRAQCAHIGCPIVGDSKYGSITSWKPGAIALHHAKMVVKHPVVDKELLFESNAGFI